MWSLLEDIIVLSLFFKNEWHFFLQLDDLLLNVYGSISGVSEARKKWSWELHITWGISSVFCPWCKIPELYIRNVENMEYVFIMSGGLAKNPPKPKKNVWFKHIEWDGIVREMISKHKWYCFYSLENLFNKNYIQKPKPIPLS